MPPALAGRFLTTGPPEESLGYYCFIFCWLHQLACGILVPPPGIEPVPSAVEAQTPNHWPSRAVPGLSLLLSQGLCGGSRACGLHLPPRAVDARILVLSGHRPWKNLAVTSRPCSSAAGDESPSGVSGCSGRFEGITLNAKPLHELTPVIRLCWDTTNDVSRAPEPQESSPSPSQPSGERWGEVVFPLCPWLGL